MSESGVVKVFQAMSPAQLRKVARELAPYLLRGGFATAASAPSSGLANPPSDWGLMAGLIAETFPRQQQSGDSGALLVSGQLFLSAIYIGAGRLVSVIGFTSAGTPLVVGTSPHLWYAIYDKNLNLLGQTPDHGGAGWGIYTYQVYNLAAPILTGYSGIFYVGLMIAQTGGSLPSLCVAASDTNALTRPPALTGASTAGLGAVAPAVAAPLIGDYRFLFGTVA